MNGLLNGVPWWVKWVAIPVIALFIFGGLVISVLNIVIGLLFKVVIFAALVGGLVFLVKRFTSSSSRKDW